MGRRRNRNGFSRLLWRRAVRRYGMVGATIFIGLPLVLLVGCGATFAFYIGSSGSSASSQTGSINLNKGLVGWWKMAGNAKDSSPYGNNGTVFGSTLSTDREGVASSAYSFNGSNDYISTPMNGFPVGSGDRSVFAWVYASAYPAAGYSTIQIYGNWSGLHISALQINTSGELTYSYNGYNVSSVTPIGLNAWHLVGYTISSNQLTLWEDGQSQKAVALSPIPSTGSGQSNIGEFASSQYDWSGSISNMRVYNRAISGAEITAIFNGYNGQVNSASGENGLVGWWKMHGNANDSTPYSNNGTVNSTVTLASDRFGDANSAYYFSGGAYESINATGASLWTIPNGEWSMSAWIDPISYSSNPIILTGGGSGAYGYTLYINSSGQLVSTFCNTSGQCNTLTGGSISLNQWQLVTATDNGSTVQNYINGSLRGSTPVTYALSGQFQANEPLCMSNCGLSQKFSGSMSDVRIYNRALAASDVSSLYNSYNSKICLGGCGQTVGINLQKGLVGYWPFNGDTKDATPYGDNATFASGYLSLTTDRLDRANSAYNFPGLYYSYMGVSAPNPVLYTPKANQWSMSAWADPTSYSQANIIAFSSTSYGYDLIVNSSGAVNATFCNCSGSCTGVTAGNVPLNQWSLITGTYDGTTSRVYVNGVLQGSDVGNWTLCFASNQALFFSSPNEFLGNIDDIRIYNRALSTLEVQALYKEYQ